MDTDANGLEVLHRGEAVALLETREVGRLVYTQRALPAVLPVNYAVRDGGIWIWIGAASALAQALRGAVVAFQVDGLDEAPRSGWSVTVTGLAEAVTDEAQLARARVQGPAPWAPGRKEHLIRIPLTMVSGRRLGSVRAADPRTDPGTDPRTEPAPAPGADPLAAGPGPGPESGFLARA